MDCELHLNPTVIERCEKCDLRVSKDYIDRIIALQHERDLLKKIIQAMDPELGRHVEFIDLEGRVEEVARERMWSLRNKAELARLRPEGE